MPGTVRNAATCPPLRPALARETGGEHAGRVPLTRRRAGLNLSDCGRTISCEPFPGRPGRPGTTHAPLTRTIPAPILRFPSTTKGGDPVSYTKRCHLAGIAR